MNKETAQAQTANQAAQAYFPGIPLDAYIEREANVTECPSIDILDLRDEFWALTIGPAGNPNTPIVYFSQEDRFRKYNTSTGIYDAISEFGVVSDVLMNMDGASAFFPARLNISSYFAIRNRGRIKSVVERAKDLLGVDSSYFTPPPYTLPFQNGILRTDTLAFSQFSPNHPLLETLPVKYDAHAKCDLFVKSFLQRVLSPDDIDLLQRYCSQILEGRNHAQAILVLTGDAGWGKSSLMKILGHFMGWKNVGIIRNQIFTNEFEFSHYANKKLLYCPDMPTDFLDRKEATIFKQMVGGDPIWADVKNSDMLTLEGNFPLILACNGKPRIHLDQDLDAWLRRLVVLSFKKAEDDMHIGKLAELILKTESAGILNWLLEGRAKLQKDKLHLTQTEPQKERSAMVLMESESPLAFVRSCIQKEAGGVVWLADLYEKYQAWCRKQSLAAFTSKDFMSAARNEIEVGYGMRPRHDLKAANGKAKRGWMGLALKLENVNN